MIKLLNIKRNNNIISLDVVSDDLIPVQKYKLTINFSTNYYETNIQNPNILELNKIFYKLSQYIEKNIDIPKEDCIAYY